MKTKIILLVLIFAACSCEKRMDEPCSCSGEDKLREEVREVVKNILKGCEEVNADKVTRSCDESSDFVYLFHGTTYTFQEFADALKNVYSKMTDQKVTIIDEEYEILDETTVLYTTNCTFLQHFRDGESKLIDPMAMLFIFKKIDGKWRWIYGVESYG